VRPSASTKLRSLALEDPDRPAIVARDRSLSYAELDAAVEQLAAWLLARRTSGAAGIVALRYRGTVPLIISSLALSRSGVVCALIDPLAPAARVRLVVDDLRTEAGPPLLITDSPDDLAEHPGSVLFSEIPVDPDAPLVPASAELDTDELQNIIYTSGSTGVPVGLCVSGRHREAIAGWTDTIDAFRDRARVGAIAAGSLGQGAELPRIVLATGATILVHDVLVDGLDTLPRWLREQRVELVPLVPTLIRFLLPLFAAEVGPDGVFPDLTTVAVWGESSDWNDLTGLCRHLRPDAMIHNAYGTTETGIIAALSLSAAEVGPVGERTGPVPAGRPLPVATIRILDPDGEDVPPGTPGEIAVSSGHLSGGYWRRPDLTASTYSTGPDGRTLCRTGDGGRIDTDGVLHVTGRLDDVVKISGHRVALGELEQAAREQPGVASATAVARPDPHGAMRLHLFVVPRPGAVLETRWLRAGIARTLPPAMLPDTVDVLESLPLLGNGKVDRKSLPEPAPRGTSPAPTDVTLVGQLRDLFAEVLGGGVVAADDDFFELGGDSLRAGRLVASLQSRFGYYVPTSLLLEAATPASLAAALSGAQEAALVPVRTAGTGVPLFVVHGGAGDVMFARSIAGHLDAEQPVYALQPPPLRGPHPFVPTLQEMADRYLEEIRRVWPSGPYRLFGYSMGGIIAFEMAVLLQAAGHQVELLALGDTPTPENLESAWQAQHATDDQQVRPGLSGKVVTHLQYRRRQLRRKLAGEVTDTEYWQQFLGGATPAPQIRADAYIHVYGRVAGAHRIGRHFVGDVTLVVAGHGGVSGDGGWEAYVDGQVQRVVLDVTHEELVLEPAIGDLSRALTCADDVTGARPATRRTGSASARR
jgi:nonribosomal peptide synthetase DhbF